MWKPAAELTAKKVWFTSFVSGAMSDGLPRLKQQNLSQLSLFFAFFANTLHTKSIDVLLRLLPVLTGTVQIDVID